MHIRWSILALFVLSLGIVIGSPARPEVDPAQPPPARQPRVEAVFVLDTTGSMGGLIQAAKDNIWSIAASLAAAQPTPLLRIGLVAYRDRGDDYVTHVVDLSTDLDAVHLALMGMQAGGGGDGPEAVNDALHDAVERMSWSTDAGAYKVIFLVGDAPPQMHYENDVKYPATLALARQRGIVVNAIQAGSDVATGAAWRHIARLGGGTMFTVGQQGDAVAVTTPYDAEIARVSRQLDATRMFYGAPASRAALARKAAVSAELERIAPVAARAKRALFNASAAGAANFLAGADLVDDVQHGKVDVDTLDANQLPPALAALPPASRRETLTRTARQRTELRAQLESLAEKRRAHVDAELAGRADVAASLDQQMFEVVKAQAASKGLEYSGHAAH